MNFLRRFVLTIVFCCICAVTAQAQTPDTSSLADTKKRLEDARREAERILNSQGDLFKQLDVLDRELELSSKLVRQLRMQAQETEAAIKATEDTLSYLRESNASEEPFLVQRIRTVYTNQRVNDVFIPLTKTDLIEAKANQLYSRKLMENDSRRLGFFRMSITGNEELLANLQVREDDLRRLVSARTAEEKRARAALLQREKVLASLKGESRDLSVEISKFEQTAQTVGDIFAEIEKSARSASDYVWNREREFSLGMKGRFFWPVQGEVVDEFGTKVDRKTRLSSKNNGIIIKASAGDKVVAALTGEVIYIGWARGLERFVVVDHGGSIYSLYGRLGELSVKEGDQVIRGESFATAAGNGLHFEIRDGKSPVNPMNWLRK